MKIIHVAQFLGIGGLEKILFHLAKAQIKDGHDVNVYVYDHERSWVPYFQRHGINVVTPPSKKPGYDWQLFKRMMSDCHDAQIIHTHDLNPLMYLAPITLLKKIKGQKHYKLIHTTHGLDHLTHSKKIKLYEKLTTLISDDVIAVSDRIKNFYMQEVNLNKSKIHYVPNGIETWKGEITEELKKEKRRWLCKKHNLDFDRPIVLSLSRVVPLKDQKFLINAFKKRPEYQLLIVGPSGEDKYFNECKSEEDVNIKIVGGQEMVSDYNLGADLYVSASKSEGLPVAVLEAMAVETPCLVSDIPGHQTLNNHGAYVDLFQLGDLTGFLDKCDYLLTHPQELQTKVERSRQSVEDFFSVGKMVKNYFEIYQA